MRDPAILRRDAPRRAATFRESTRTRQTRRCRGAIYDLGLGRGRRTLMLNKISRVISQSVSHANNIRGPVNAMLIKRTRRDRAPRVSVIRPPPPPPPPPTPEHSFAGKNRGSGPGGGQLDGSRRRRLPHPTIARRKGGIAEVGERGRSSLSRVYRIDSGCREGETGSHRRPASRPEKET